MSPHRFSLPGSFTALFSVGLAVMFLATAPIMVGTAEAQPRGMAMAAMSATSDACCAAMTGHASHSLGKHTKCCLALCLAGHGVLLSEAPTPQTAWRYPAMPGQALFMSELLAHMPGVDPPPPRQS